MSRVNASQNYVQADRHFRASVSPILGFEAMTTFLHTSKYFSLPLQGLWYLILQTQSTRLLVADPSPTGQILIAPRSSLVMWSSIAIRTCLPLRTRTQPTIIFSTSLLVSMAMIYTIPLGPIRLSRVIKFDKLFKITSCHLP